MHINIPERDCPIRNICNLRDTDKCWQGCWKMAQLAYQLRHSGIPLDYQADVPLTKAAEGADYSQFVTLAGWLSEKTKLHWRIREGGEGMFLYSKKKGNGKTSWACKIAFNYLRGMGARIESLEEPLVKFVSVPRLFDTLRAGMDNPSAEVRNLEKSILSAELLILDDIGAESPSKWVREKLYIYLNEREANHRATIFTSNVSLDELEETLGDRITDRIYGLCRKRYGSDWREVRTYNIFEFTDSHER